MRVREKGGVFPQYRLPQGQRRRRPHFRTSVTITKTTDYGSVYPLLVTRPQTPYLFGTRVVYTVGTKTPGYTPRGQCRRYRDYRFHVFTPHRHFCLRLSIRVWFTDTKTPSHTRVPTPTTTQTGVSPCRLWQRDLRCHRRETDHTPCTLPHMRSFKIVDPSRSRLWCS